MLPEALLTLTLTIKINIMKAFSLQEWESNLIWKMSKDLISIHVGGG